MHARAWPACHLSIPTLPARHHPGTPDQAASRSAAAPQPTHQDPLPECFPGLQPQPSQHTQPSPEGSSHHLPTFAEVLPATQLGRTQPGAALASSQSLPSSQLVQPAASHEPPTEVSLAAGLAYAQQKPPRCIQEGLGMPMSDISVLDGLVRGASAGTLSDSAYNKGKVRKGCQHRRSK